MFSLCLAIQKNVVSTRLPACQLPSLSITTIKRRVRQFGADLD